MRGWASLAVVIFHTTWELFGPILPEMRRYFPGPANDGKLAVYVFFVLSGLVLARAVTHPIDIQRVRRMALGRYARLAVPILLASLIGFLMLEAGLFFNAEAGTVIRATWVAEPFTGVAPSVGSWIGDSLWYVFRGGGSYGPFLWTMPIELFGSYLLFATIALFGQAPVLRIGVFAVQAAVWAAVDDYYAAFFCGALLAEVMPWLRVVPRPVREAAGLVLLAAGYLEAALFRYQLILPASVALVAAALLSPTLRWVLQSRVSQFLGRISFPLYLTHCFVIYGPACWAIVRLHEGGMEMAQIAWIVAPSTIVAAILLGWAMSPIDAAGKWAAHRSGRFLAEMGARLPTARLGSPSRAS